MATNLVDFVFSMNHGALVRDSEELEHEFLKHVSAKQIY